MGRDIRPIRGLRRHPLSECFGDIDDDDLIALSDDIKQNGQRLPIVVMDGVVLDGWHRAMACQMAGIEGQFREYTGSDPVGYVISMNAHRRQMSASQRAAAVARCRSFDSYEYSAPGAVDTAPTVSQMADEAGVSKRTMAQAKAAEEAGLGDAVLAGEMSAKEANEQAQYKKNPERKPKDPDAPRPPTMLERARARITELEQELAEVRDANAELLDEVESLRDAARPENDQQRVFNELRESLRVMRTQRDQKQHEITALQRDNKAMRRKLEQR